jgi:alanine racemase
MAMVKASAYGSGSVEVAQLLQYHHVDYLGVAYVDEGVALRKRGISIPIVVMNTAPIEFELLCQYQLQPVLYGFEILMAFESYLQSNSNTNYPVHIELDTGMGRLGFVAEEVPKLMEALSVLQCIQVESIFAHLAAADEAKHAAYTYHQIREFEQLAHQIKERLSITPILHILNSAGIIHYNNHQMDMVRLGIGLYGVSRDLTLDLQSVAKLKTTILQIKTATKGQTIGYGRQGEIKKYSRIAVLAIGYADGLLRAAGNGNFAMKINGQLAPTVGNICMDMCFVDVSAIPTAKVGDPVIVFDDKERVHQLADTMNTIAYEVLTNINDRVPRVFYED